MLSQAQTEIFALKDRRSSCDSAQPMIQAASAASATPKDCESHPSSTGTAFESLEKSDWHVQLSSYVTSIMIHDIFWSSCSQTLLTRSCFGSRSHAQEVAVLRWPHSGGSGYSRASVQHLGWLPSRWRWKLRPGIACSTPVWNWCCGLSLPFSGREPMSHLQDVKVEFGLGIPKTANLGDSTASQCWFDLFAGGRLFWRSQGCPSELWLSG